jgi:hypothetical protein
MTEQNTVLDPFRKELIEESNAPKKIERIKFGLFSVNVKQNKQTKYLFYEFKN